MKELNVAIENDVDVEISGLTHPVICSPLGTHVDLHSHPQLRGLKIAGRSAACNKRIDILIGADCYYTLVLGEVLKGCSGSVAISSKLGWLLSGPVACFNDNFDDYTNVASHLVIDTSSHSMYTGPNTGDKQPEHSSELVHALNEFWQHEKCGLHKHEKDLEIENKKSDPFDITFNGTRYEVSLPWKCKNLDDLPDDY